MDKQKIRKAEFVQALLEFYKGQVKNPIGLTGMEYESKDNEEYVVVSFGYAKKRFSVRGDNEQGILEDFLRFMGDFNSYAWEFDDEI